jgi:predicted alpha/beta hydrolase family esterase
MSLHIVFSHGKESGPWGSKIKSMAEQAKQYGDIHSIDYRDLPSPDDRVERLLTHLAQLTGNIVLVGSSMGGYVSTAASCKVELAGMFLLAPAFYLNGYDIQEPATHCKHVSVVHGWNDDVVPYANSVRFAAHYKASLKLVDDGHRLSNSQNVLHAELIAVLSKV